MGGRDPGRTRTAARLAPWTARGTTCSPSCRRCASRAGEPSYAELARRVTEQRVAAGVDAHAARVAKSTVHDAFRLGRSRVNLPLTRELVVALGADPGLVDRWRERPSPEPACGADRGPGGAPAGCRAWRPTCSAGSSSTSSGCRSTSTWSARRSRRSASARGAGRRVGLATNVLGVIGSGWVSLPFAAVNVVGALVLGYGVHRWGLGRTLPRFFALMRGHGRGLLRGRGAGHRARVRPQQPDRARRDHRAARRLDRARSGWCCPFSNLLTSLADKIISGFVALVVVACLPVGFRRHLPLGDGARAGAGSGPGLSAIRALLARSLR